MGGEGGRNLGPKFGPKHGDTRRNQVVLETIATQHDPLKMLHKTTARYRLVRTPAAFKTGAQLAQNRLARAWKTAAYYSRKHTSMILAAQAASSATVSATCTPSPDVLKVVPMTAKTSGNSTRESREFFFAGFRNRLQLRCPVFTSEAGCPDGRAGVDR